MFRKSRLLVRAAVVGGGAYFTYKNMQQGREQDRPYGQKIIQGG